MPQSLHSPLDIFTSSTLNSYVHAYVISYKITLFLTSNLCKIVYNGGAVTSQRWQDTMSIRTVVILGIASLALAWLVFMLLAGQPTAAHDDCDYDPVTGELVCYDHSHSTPTATAEPTPQVNCSDVIKPTENCLPSPAPANLTVGTVTQSSVSLSWSSVSGAAEYRVEYKRNTASSWTNDGTTSGTSYTVTGLDEDTAYQFRVRSRGDGSESTTSYEGTTPTSAVSARTEEDVPVNCADVIKPTENCLPSPAPANLTVGTVTQTSVRLSWDSVSGAAEYRVEYKESTASSWTNDGTTSGTSYTVTGLDDDTAYQFRVRSRGDGSESTTSYEGTTPTSPVNARTEEDVPVNCVDVIKPTENCLPSPAPATLTVGTITKTSVSLSWSSVSGAAEYRVEYAESGSDSWTEDGTTTSTSYTVSGLVCNTGYQFRVRSRGDGSESTTGWEGTTPTSAKTATTALCIPTAPTEFTATVSGGSWIGFRWDSLTGADKYEIYSKTADSQDYNENPDATETGTSVRLRLYPCDTTTHRVEYDFRIRAFGDGSTLAAEWGSYSATSVDMACPPPIVYTAAAASQTSIDLTWGSIDGVTRFRVFYRGKDGGSFTLDSDQIPASSTGYTVDDLHCGTTYRFSVSALGDGTTYAPRWSATESQYHQEASIPCTGRTVSFGSSTYSVGEGSDQAITVQMSPAADTSITIPVTVTAGSAESGDYSVSGLTSGNLTFASGDTQRTFTIRANSDTDSDDETVDLEFGTLPSGVTEGSPSSSVLTIVEDRLVSFSSSTYSVSEGSSQTITVQMSPAANTSFTIPVMVDRDTAESGDYSVSGLTSGNLTFASGDTQRTFTIRANSDTDSDDETVDLEFGTLPSGVTEGSPSSSVLTIVEDRLVSFSSSTYSVSEGSSQTITVQMSPAANTSFTIPVMVDRDTAESGDYSVLGLSGGNLTFASGDTQRTFTIRANSDTDSDDETVDLEFGTLPDGVTAVSPSTSTMFILDDDETEVSCIDVVMPNVNCQSPPGPRTVTVGTITKTSISLSWTTVSGVNEYRVEYRVDGSGDDWMNGGTTTGTSYTVTGLTCGTTYNFGVRSHGDGTGDKIVGWGTALTLATLSGSSAVPTAICEAAPTFDEGTSAERSVPENTASDVNIGSPVSATDADSPDLTYSLSGTDAGSFDFDTGTGQLKTRAALDYETKSSYGVIVEVNDGKNDQGGPDDSIDDSISVTINVTDVDEPAAPPTPTDVPLLVIQAGGITLLAGYQAPSDSFHYQLTLSWSLDGRSSSYQPVVSHDVDESATTQEFPGSGNPIARPGHYKVGLRACRDEARTDDQCGEYAESQPLLFPTLALPTIEVDSNDRNDIKLVDGYRLPPPAFTYKIALFLESSIVSSSETRISTGNYSSLPPMAAGAYQVGITACDPATGVECVPYVLSTQYLTKLAAPENLDVVPRYKREAMLVWRGVDNATEYKVEARDPEILNNMPMDRNRWNPLHPEDMTPDCRIPPFQTAYVCRTLIDLDAVIELGIEPRGLAHADTYEVRVTATNPGSPYLDHSSDLITIIDTPIYRVDGYNAKSTDANAGEAHIKWRAPSPAAQAGSFKVRYRKARRFAFVGAPHTDPAWKPGTFDPSDVDGVTGSSQHTIRDLTLKEIYAVQLYYTDATGKQVYTARDAYVWPSDNFPPHNERVATFPFFGHFSSKTYDYRICDEDEAFPDDDPSTPENEKTQWITLMEQALGQWETSTKDGNDKIITMSYNDGACTDLSDLSVFKALLNDADDGLSEIRIFDLAPGADTYFIEMLSDPFKLCILDAYVCVTSRSGYLTLPRQADFMLPSADITLNFETIRNKLRLNAGEDPEPIVPDSIAFNACRENGQPTMDDNLGGFFVYALLVHEAGHALGLSDWSPTEIARQAFQDLVDDLDPVSRTILRAAALPLFLSVPENVYEVSHPTIADSVMNYDRETPVTTEHDCSPHPFDVMALHALYQNVNR